MRLIRPVAAILVLTACASVYHDPLAYWTRPDATLPELAQESRDCYRAAVEADAPATDAPSALPRAGATPSLLPPTQPPPKLWELAPRNAGFERFEEQLRYERCMTMRGWSPTRAAAPTL